MYRRQNGICRNPATTPPSSRRRIRTSPLIAQVLLNRGITEPDACQSFLRPSLKELYEPHLISGLTVAAERIAKAVRNRSNIVIYGDYDVDGIAATAILWHAIRMLGGTASYYIPHRIDEGYGLNPDAVAQICTAGANLIITVDCGITAIKSADVAKEHGVDLIITDHHKSCSSDLPDCFSIVHPRLEADAPPYPNANLCGAGVAFKLAWGIGQAHSGGAKVSDEFREFLMEASRCPRLERLPMSFR